MPDLPTHASGIVEILYALIPVIAWGAWLAPSHNVRFPNQQVKTLYVTSANLGLALVVLLVQGIGGLKSLSLVSFWLVFSGGVLWAFSGLCAFTATAQIGTARAFGIWAPLNIIVSMLWGALLFSEFPDLSLGSRLTLMAALAIILAGVLMIIFAKETRGQAHKPASTLMSGGQARGPDPTGSGRRAWLGYAGAVGAGVLWGSYYIPIQAAGVSMAVGAFPLAIGMFSGSILLARLAGQSPHLARSSDVLRALLTGLMWGVGNYGMLLLVGALGAGRGFTISQLSVVVNALVGILWLKDPHPRSRAAWLTLLGCVLATVGGILLGGLKR
jgi:glucose uptake protein